MCLLPPWCISCCYCEVGLVWQDAFADTPVILNLLDGLVGVWRWRFLVLSHAGTWLHMGPLVMGLFVCFPLLLLKSP